MSSVKREYSLPGPSITNVPVTDGNGRDPSGNIAKAFLDMTTACIFRLDLSGLTHSGGNVYLQLDTHAAAPGALAGKEITILFSGTPDSRYVYVYFTSNFGQNTTLYNDGFNTYTENYNQPSAMKLISNGTDFIITEQTLYCW